ncbi:HK97 family phage prohead protease [Mycolicibacterium austroafricanum]|uniref:HK97 family phage prohead protease n=1 Tax=Mycolicibacterium austroafricanum TaxID=39687 RepID=UPI001ABFEA02|nr:HK97 family phage prohead protease [Mycolicibacterium austroafricanum]QRZ05898.1 HK97 family phage prohead protease [Mycolicibacterium austroafricanum]
MEGVREAPFKLVRSEEEGDGLTLDGYGAVFGRMTVIDSWEGRFREQIALGAMKRSFRESPPKIQFDHGKHPMIGSIPIAKLERIAEEVDPDLAPEGGAHIIGRVFNNWLMAPVRDAIEAQAIDGMSFRFGVVREQWATADGRQIRDRQALLAELDRTWDAPEEDLPVRTLKELKVPEMGPVVWPAYSDTSVGVRSIIDLGALRNGDPEQRKLLAEAVFIADAASQDETPQRDTTDEVVVERQEDSEDAQQSTSATPVGEHPSKPIGRRPIDVTLRSIRDMQRDIQTRKDSK